MRSIAVITLALGALMWGSAAPAETSGKSAIARATTLLAGKRFTRSSSYVDRLHLCGNGRFVLDEVASPGQVSRTVGRWRVLSASVGRNRAVARVRGVSSNRAFIVMIATDGRRTTVGGEAAAVERSGLCR